MEAKTYPVCIIGAGLAGSECAWQLAKRGIQVCLVEMRPKKTSPAHQSDMAAELVCSNSFRGSDSKNAVGLLKEEMAALDSLIIKAALETKVPAGGALAVDRERFSTFVTNQLHSLNQITFVNDTVIGFEKSQHLIQVLLESGQSINCEQAVIATGPLTDDTLATWIQEKTGKEHLYFYDAIAPIIEKESIDMRVAFRANRYGGIEDTKTRKNEDTKVEGDYINCPMDKDEYYRFITEIKNAELAPVHEFDKACFFDGCLPIEEMVRRGDETLRYGPLKPVGLWKQKMMHDEIRVAGSQGRGIQDTSSRNEERGTKNDLYAVVQLRQDNLHDTLYNMVGFQTRMRHGDQKRIIRMIPGLADAKFLRLGSMHRNTFISSPILLNESFELKTFPNLHFAGQIAGCEGYVESAAIGLYVGLSQVGVQMPPQTTALGALVHHVLHADPEHFQPMNVNFGLFAPFETMCRMA